MHARLPDVLRCLGSQAADSVFDSLGKRSLAAARLSCRALRNFIDSSATRLAITVRAADRQRWEGGQLPPSMTRWPRCRRLTVLVDVAEGAGDGGAMLALLPFVEPAAGRQIETLSLNWRTIHSSATIGEGLVCMLVPMLPNLRELDFMLQRCMSFDPFKQQLMYAALTALPHLERLTLPGSRSTERVGALAACTSLRRLKIVCYGETLTAASISGLMCLQQLEELELPSYQLGADGDGSGAAPSGVRALLRAGFPPSLQQLKVGVIFDYNSALLNLQLHGGVLRHVSISGPSELLQLDDLAALVQLLLDSPAMGPTLGLLSFECIEMSEEGLAGLQQAGQAQLRKLLQRCTKVETEGVWITSAAPFAAVVELLPLLRPDDITLQFRDDQALTFDMPFRSTSSTSETPTGISGPTAGMGAGAGPLDAAVLPTSDGEGLGPQQPCTPPGPADLLRAALERIAAGGAPSSQQQAASSSSSSTEGGAAVEVTGSSCAPGARHLLLLHGPFVAMMIKSGLAPTEWVRCLAAQAKAAAPDNDWTGAPVLLCQVLPPVAGVLLSCYSADAAAAVAAAAGSAAEAAAPAVPLLEVMHLRSTSISATVALFNALTPVMTAFWEGTAHGGERCTQHERLQCLLAMRNEFSALPEETGV
ncbi:hypothetical protein TSOC_009337 [Tetrabaena socialis]|uniref:F-box domain-containing protein n=1 Tax=Tetrabaena socialis TaxID=47790 RepID=A0A2J7ZW75_9CHLO|nr:hypothetical protein TSOC_009337 [Tetrabaena socialis]|eukprot:PNH04505.1 hypothetical protein TSOC_009337 [Tetrabaena socialis]